MTDPDAPGFPGDDDLATLDDLEDLDGEPGKDPGGDGGLSAAPADDRARVQALERRLLDLEERLDAAAAGAAEPAPAPASAVVKSPRYEALAEFVNEEFAPRYTRRRHGGKWRWCAQWWEHAEAVSRLGALHLAWEAMHDDGPTGLGDWYRNHLDHQLPILMGADGPFRRCGDQHYPPDPDDDLRCGTPHGTSMAWRHE